jgi:hypothetical protein
MTSAEKKPSPAGRIKVHLPADLEPIYANLALITHSPSEIVLDYAQVMPQNPRAKVKSRVVMTPINAKFLLRALGEHLARYEAQHGEIKMPQGPTLADQLFGGKPGEETGEEAADE